MWSTTNKGKGIDLLPNNEVVTNTQGHVIAYKKYKKWETTLTEAAYPYHMCGISQVGADYGNFVGATDKSIGITQSGLVVRNSQPIGYSSDGGYVIGATIGFILEKKRLTIFRNGTQIFTMPIESAAWLPADGAQNGGTTKSRTEFK